MTKLVGPSDADDISNFSKAVKIISIERIIQVNIYELAFDVPSPTFLTPFDTLTIW